MATESKRTDGSGAEAEDAGAAPAAADTRPQTLQEPVPDALPTPSALPQPQIVPQPTRHPTWFRPVFVLAPARSNSSVVSSMIGMHPELYGFPELSLFRDVTVAQLLASPPGWRGLPARTRTAGLARALAELHEGKQDEASVWRARHWLECRPEWEAAAVFDHLLALVAPRVGLEKSPENSNREDYLERLETAYPRCRFLHVTRHPVTTVQSMYAAWSPLGLWMIPDELFHLHLLGTWLFHHARVKRFTESLPPDRWIRVRSEDVLNAPREELPRICRWLGIDHGDDAIEAMLHPEKSPYARLGPRNAMGGNDPGFLEAPVPRQAVLPTTLDIPKEWVVDPWLYVSVVEFAATLGYKNERATRAATSGPQGTPRERSSVRPIGKAARAPTRRRRSGGRA